MYSTRVHDRLSELPPELVQALRARQDDVFCSLDWFAHYERSVLAPSASVRAYCLTPSASDVAALPCVFALQASAGAVRRLASAANYYTPLFHAIGRRDVPDEAVDALAAAIDAERPHWDVIDFHPLDAGAPLFRQLQQALRTRGMLVEDYSCFGNWYLEVGGRSYREYHAALPSRLRNTMRRKAAKLAAAGRLRMELLTDAADLARGIAAFEAVYAASWKRPEPYPDFMPGLMRLCARHGWLRLGIAWIDGEPAAAQLWTVAGGTASIFKLAYDERFAEHSVGSLLTAHLMEHVIDRDRVDCVDFLSGDDGYKSDWMSHRRERRGIIACNLRTVRGFLAAMRLVGGRFRRRWLATQDTAQRAST